MRKNTFLFFIIFMMFVNLLMAQSNLRPINMTADVVKVLSKSFLSARQVDIWSNPYTAPEVGMQKMLVFFANTSNNNEKMSSLAEVLSENVQLNIFGKKLLRLYGGVFYQEMDGESFEQITTQNISEAIKLPRPLNIMMADEVAMQQVWSLVEGSENDFFLKLAFFLGKPLNNQEKVLMINLRENILEGENRYIFKNKLQFQQELLKLKYSR